MIYPNIFLIAQDLLFWVVVFVSFKQVLNKPYKTSLNNRRIGLLFILIYILFSFWGDWFHYNREVVLMHNGSGYGYEEIYNWIINNVTFHYLIFRIIVWGSSFILLWKTARRLRLNIDLILLFLGCGWISLFAYARVTLAMTIMFYGFSLIYAPSELTFFNRLIGFVLIFSSFFFHKSAAFGICMILCGIIASKLNWKLLLILLMLVPLLIGIFRNYLTIFMANGGGDYDPSFQMSVTSGQRYLQQNSEDTGWGALIRFIFEYSAYYIMAFLCVLTIWGKKKQLMNKQMETLSIICLLIIICASIFAFDLGFNTKVLYIRFLRFAIIPSLLLMTYYYQIGFHRKIVKVIFISTCCMTVYATLYTIHLCNVGVDLVGR